MLCTDSLMLFFHSFPGKKCQQIPGLLRFLYKPLVNGFPGLAITAKVTLRTTQFTV